jgi:RND family efflux transporter MFP subunit
MEFHNQITLVGRTQALANSRIVAEVAGRVVDVGAREGNPIERGGLLVSIDPDKIKLTLEAKRAQVAQARATAELAAKELERSRDLRERDLVSQGGFDAALAEHSRAQGLYDQYVAEMKQLELDLENCAIRAPFDGYTGRQLVDPGEWVNPGTPVYEVVDLNTIKVIVDLPERHFGQVDKGSTVNIRVSGESEHTVSGVVTGIAPAASEVTHTFAVIIAVDNRERRLGGGMLVRTTLSLSGVFTSLAVNKDAIVRQGNQTLVYTVNEGKAAPIPVQTSSTEGEMVAVSGDALAEGMTVIVRGNERVFPGSPVRTADGGGPGGGPAATSGDESSEKEETAEAGAQDKG